MLFGLQSETQLENEVSILSLYVHKNIVRFIGSEWGDNTLRIFLEYVPGGSLCSLIHKFGALEEQV